MTPTPRISTPQRIAIAAIVAAGALAGAAILSAERTRPTDEHGHAAGHEQGDGHDHRAGHAEEEQEPATKGPHGGQWLADGDFGLEVRLAGQGGQAYFEVWVFEKNKPLPAGAAQVAITLTLPDGEQRRFPLVPGKDGLRSTQPVPQPHLFEATIEAQTPKEVHLFTFSRQEGRVAMSDAQLKSAGISVEPAAPARIRSTLQLPGQIRLDEDRTAHVVPRVAGMVESVQVSLGQRVRRGQVLAVISSASVSEHRSDLQTAQKRLALARTTYEREKRLWEERISPQQDLQQAEQALREAEITVENAKQKLLALGVGPGAGALARFELRAPFDGTVVEKHIAPGESVKEDANVFTVSDLSTVWAEIDIAARDLNRVRVGEPATIRSTAFDETAGGSVAYVGALLGEQTRTAKARIALPNPTLAWRPGLYVTVEIVASQADVPVSVSGEAIQQLGDRPVVFLKVPGGFVPQPVEVGRSDGGRVEIVAGLKPGVPHAAAGSFIVKSEAGKGSARHTH